MASSKEFLDSNQEDIMSKIANSWWDENGFWICLQTMNKVRVPFICEGLEKVGRIMNAKAPNSLEGIKILDIGCGAGILSEKLAELQATVIGIEPVEEVVEAAKAHVKLRKDLASRITYFCETIEEHSVKNSKVYDVIVASEVIEHVENKDTFLRACAMALKNDGNLFITCPNQTYASFYINRIWGEMILNVIPRFSHKYSWFIHHEDLEKKVKEYGLKKKIVKGLLYLPLIRKWFVIGYPGLTYMAHFRKESGSLRG